MYRIRKYSEIEKYSSEESVIFVDVRSPGEYKEARIPGSINLPVLDDDARAKVGTLYVQGHLEESKLAGITHVSQKLPQFFQEISQLVHDYHHVVVYCARGGYRSTAFVSLMQGLGESVEKLDGGYKGYRAHVRTNLPNLWENLEFIVLDGYTGTGKTEILQAIEESGGEILDLENLANHRGSLLGSVGLGDQPSQKQFESYLYLELKKKKGVVFTEGESIRIGQRTVPKDLYEKIKSGTHVRISDTLERRSHRIAKEYLSAPREEIKGAILSMERYLSAKTLKEFLTWLDEGRELDIIRRLITGYYDPGYRVYPQYVEEVDNKNSQITAGYLMKKYGKK